MTLILGTCGKLDRTTLASRFGTTIKSSKGLRSHQWRPRDSISRPARSKSSLRLKRRRARGRKPCRTSKTMPVQAPESSINRLSPAESRNSVNTSILLSCGKVVGNLERLDMVRPRSRISVAPPSNARSFSVAAPLRSQRMPVVSRSCMPQRGVNPARIGERTVERDFLEHGLRLLAGRSANR